MGVPPIQERANDLKSKLPPVHDAKPRPAISAGRRIDVSAASGFVSTGSSSFEVFKFADYTAAAAEIGDDSPCRQGLEQHLLENPRLRYERSMVAIVIIVICLFLMGAIQKNLKEQGYEPLSRGQMRYLRKKARKQGVDPSQVSYRPRRGTNPYGPPSKPRRPRGGPRL